jgi:hypothetical protein
MSVTLCKVSLFQIIYPLKAVKFGTKSYELCESNIGISNIFFNNIYMTMHGTEQSVHKLCPKLQQQRETSQTKQNAFAPNMST